MFHIFKLLQRVEYAKTRNILHVKKLLGHRSLGNTLIILLRLQISSKKL